MRRRTRAGAAGYPLIGQLGHQAAVAVAPAVTAKGGLDEFPHLLIGDLGLGGRCSVVKAAAGLTEHGADLADAGTGFPG